MQGPQSSDELARELATHGSYAAVARAHGMPVSTLKTRAAKWVAQDDEPVEREPWGLGGPAHLSLPEPLNGTDWQGVGIFDLHGKHREQRLFNAQLQVVEDTLPDFVAIGGDALNFDIISRWQDKQLKRLTPLDLIRKVRAEIDDFKRNILHPIREAAGNAVVFMVEGNHDDRLRKYLSDDLHDAWEESRRLLGVDDYLDGYYTRAGVFVVPEHLVRHGDSTAQNPAKIELKNTDCSGWSGHVHTAHQWLEKPYPLTGRRLTHTIAPASCRLDANYGSGNAGLMRWHQGMLAGTFSSRSNHDHHTDIGLWNGSDLLLRGVRYR